MESLKAAMNLTLDVCVCVCVCVCVSGPGAAVLGGGDVPQDAAAQWSCGAAAR